MGGLLYSATITVTVFLLYLCFSSASLVILFFSLDSLGTRFGRVYHRAILNNHIKDKETKKLVDMLQDRNMNDITFVIDGLRTSGKFTDGSLHDIRVWGGDFTAQDIHGFDLSRSQWMFACFKSTQLSQVNFKNARIVNSYFDKCIAISTNFEGAVICGSHLRAANLSLSSFKAADLEGCNFTGAILDEANVMGANLQNVALRHASITGTMFSKNTKLPDSTDTKPVYWRRDTDMMKYIDPKHPDFWEPEDIADQNRPI